MFRGPGELNPRPLIEEDGLLLRGGQDIDFNIFSHKLTFVLFLSPFRTVFQRWR